MDWYYAIGGERKGPVSDQEFQRLVHQGIVNSQTLVWREGMANWQPYDGGGAPPPIIGEATPGAADGVICAGCGGTFADSEVISLPGGRYCAACKPLALQRIKEGAPTTTAAEEIRNKHLKHEASIKAVGVLYYLGGAALLLGGIISAVSMGQGNSTIAAIIGAVFFTVMGVAQLWTGAGLRRLKSWARIATGILSGIGLLGFPLGTIINAYILYLVFSQKGKTVFSEEYQVVIAQTPHIKYRTSIVVWILLGLLVAIFAIALVGAFLGVRR